MFFQHLKFLFLKEAGLSEIYDKVGLEMRDDPSLLIWFKESVLISVKVKVSFVFDDASLSVVFVDWWLPLILTNTSELERIFF